MSSIQTVCGSAHWHFKDGLLTCSGSDNDVGVFDRCFVCGHHFYAMEYYRASAEFWDKNRACIIPIDAIGKKDPKLYPQHQWRRLAGKAFCSYKCFTTAEEYIQQEAKWLIRQKERLRQTRAAVRNPQRARNTLRMEYARGMTSQTL